ncbi:MAG: hypothetical protein FWG55_01385, partial [Candidatus Bathyarchaeota archaeon]|nr:hypothetical protein [Candidatus Termiticorpusculum sp.]
SSLITPPTNKIIADTAKASAMLASTSSLITPETAAYVGHKTNKTFHLPSCSALPQEQSREYFASRQAAEDAKYTPCVKCKP